MAKLTKAQAKAHNQACELLKKDVLTEDEKIFVFENWQESASHINSSAGAFFTPYELAMDFAIEAHAGRVIDLCAGIGMLSFALQQRNYGSGQPLNLTCVEINADYVAVGRKLVPEATWIHASVLDILDMGFGRFDFAISNPPFGAIKRADGSRKSPRYTGADFEFHVIDIASHIANYGVFILPQQSAGFNYSGRQGYERQANGKAFEFQKKTGLHFESGCGVDTKMYEKSWRGVSPIVEIVCVEFPTGETLPTEITEPARTVERIAPAVPNTSPQFDLFAEAAE